MIFNIGLTSPDAFFREFYSHGLSINDSTATVVFELQQVPKAVRDFDNILLFSIPEESSRIVGSYDLDFIIQENVVKPKSVRWLPLKVLARKKRVGHANNYTITKIPDNIDAMLNKNSEGDLLDKVQRFLPAFQTGAKKKKIERLIFNSLRLGNLDTVVDQLTDISSKRASKEDLSNRLALLVEIKDWINSPASANMMAALKELEGQDWQSRYFSVALKYGIKKFELGYILSFMERDVK